MISIKNLIFKNKVLVAAIVFSVVWHIFWLSAFKVVVVPKVKMAVKFSNVSFLGPILERSVVSVDVKPRERTILEKNYLDYTQAQPAVLGQSVARDGYVMPGPDTALSYGNDEELTALAVAAIDTGKIEPGRDMD